MAAVWLVMVAVALSMTVFARLRHLLLTSCCPIAPEILADMAARRSHACHSCILRFVILTLRSALVLALMVAQRVAGKASWVAVALLQCCGHRLK